MRKNTKKPHFKGTFYDYNLSWKKKIDDRVKEEQAIIEETKEK